MLGTENGDVPRQWYVALAPSSNGQTHRAFAICALPHSKAKIKEVGFVLAEGQRAARTVSCGKGKRALGGGVVQAGTPDSRLRLLASGPLDASGRALNTKSGDVPKKWYGQVQNDDDGIDGNDVHERAFKVFVICAPDTKARIKATRIELDFAQPGEAVARCGPGKRALGGGAIPDQPISLRASGPLDASGEVLETDTGDVAKQWYAAIPASGVVDQAINVYAVCDA